MSCRTDPSSAIRRFSLIRPASMIRRCARVFCSFTVTCLSLASSVRGQESLQYNRDIRPILAEACFACHGRTTQKSGVRLDDRERALGPSESGAIPIVPGQPDSSELLKRVMSDDPDLVMPPPTSKKSLTAMQKAQLRSWITAGATYQKHWAYETPHLPPIPPSNDARYPIRNAVDSFIADRLRAEGLTMSAEADRPTLARRSSFALRGLPPTIQEINEFLNDTTENAYENMVDRFMASSQFGEEMARHWLDVARYADTHGLHLDNERQMWAYRDWVIRAFNTNMPFDQFTREQLAGDLLANPSVDQMVATGFNRCNVTTGEGGSIDEEWIFRNALDRTSTMAQAWMGITAGCGVCHDHKFDPLTAKEYYSLYAFFQSAADPPLDGNVLLTQPTVRLLPKDYECRLADFDRQIADLQRRIGDEVSKFDYRDPATVTPPPQSVPIESVWFDDDFPMGAKIAASPGHPTRLISAESGKVFSGVKSLHRTDSGLAQDVFENTAPLQIPPGGKLFAHVWIDAENPPRTLMLQYFKGGWLHRAVWGDYEAIAWGQPHTTERVNMGPLPESGCWVKLEVDSNRVGLQPGDSITGFALTQFGGSVYWDKVGVAGDSNPATDIHRSLLAWWNQRQGQDTKEVPAEIAAILKAGPSTQPETVKSLRDYYLEHICQDSRQILAPWKQQQTSLREQRAAYENAIPSSFVFRELPQPRESFVMLRGQYHQRGELVVPNTPSFLPPIAVTDRRLNRLDLADWLLAPEHPLTARVAVNRFWQQLFGVGLVKSSYDFGVQGDAPSHPDLLDWLACQYRDGGWNTKQMIRLLVTSAAFRQSSSTNPAVLARDPENRWLARGPRLRLDAEQIRDNSLYVSGLLNPEMGGRGVHPYQPPNIWEPVGFVGSNTATYTQDHGSALYRRSIYVFLKRTAPPPFMTNFDAPNREMLCARRERSNTPLQALQLMNDPQHFEAARKLAERMMLEGGVEPASRIQFAYRVVLSRLPDYDEQQVVEEFLRRELSRFEKDPMSAERLLANGESARDPALSVPELAACSLVANLLLNLDETITRN